jgi:hypothetical protein
MTIIIRQVRETYSLSFGFLVAYLVPGFVVLWGVSYYSPLLRAWLVSPPANLPTVGGLLYVTVGSLAAGVTASAFRWALFDTLHHRTGIAPPTWTFAALPEKLEAFQTLIEIHYRYYQTHANLLVALAFAYAMRFLAIGWQAYRLGAVDLGFIVIGVVLFLGSRDALRKYYRRAGELLKPSEIVKGGEKHDERWRSGPLRRSQGRRTEGAETHVTEE